jgi:hypothetical protein
MCGCEHRLAAHVLAYELRDQRWDTAAHDEGSCFAEVDPRSVLCYTPIIGSSGRPVMRTTTLGLGMLAAAVMSPAHSTVLTFDGNICDFFSTSACNNGRDILQTYGDQPGVLDVVYYRNGLASGIDPLLFWSTQYSGLVNVAYGSGIGTLGTAEIFLSPAPGYSVTLNGFSLGAYQVDRTSQYAILGGDGTPLSSSGLITVLGSTPTQVSVAETSSDGIRIRWGPDAYNVGIDNIDFTISGVRQIPEPSTVALLALALAGLTWRAGRKN